LYFDKTEAVMARNQSVDKHIGDVSAALTWRPMMSQNIVLGSYATLLAVTGLMRCSRTKIRYFR
jgi:hypothetical protein